MVTIKTELIEPKKDERGRRITPRAEREEYVKAYRGSGLTQKAFAEREGIKFATFASWLQEFREREPSVRVPRFAEVELQRGS